eukprot:CAMPEP_0119329436 /NCGR_PEP_ID=MMETSP1333-20130426/75833_1 /TAXON_ID=418940 /ORGANISM="Scyphosphaera apsteinii, Strain RCC1455" /LENGTH=245 /DNA_ID=CAMNT_0007338549 /DNA_START=47 /DNA_END=784 /DNA_ORIENTATION=+
MEMDSYRVGTLLELVREVAIDFAKAGFNIRICVQASWWEGVQNPGLPRVLSGCRKVVEMMDWQAQPGERNEGMLGHTDEKGNDVEGRVRFGAIGAAEVKSDDDVILCIAPQSMVGASIYEPLSQMAETVGPDRSIIVLNDNLNDRQSSGGLMGVRGRADRMAFKDSFTTVYQFKLIYQGTTFMFPIRGALRMSRASHAEGENVFYTLFAREESADSRHERYVPVGVFDKSPAPDVITKLIPPTLR